MKKITDIIIDKRYIILILFIILCVISAIWSSKVNINYDIAEYLPSTSETRIGMDIMESKFKEIESSSLNVMFENLSGYEKSQIYDELTQINGVDSVDYENTEDYNKENYTLYVVNIDEVEDSELAENVFNEITKKYDDYKFYTSGDIADRYTSVLPIGIVVLAVVCALIILIIMCESYTEPFLFMTSILMAVLLNNGTNIIFESVSNITNSIAAILQMALSMDYSIILMNRYNQERQKETDKIKAMKNALYNAFKAISSSSITTIVGLLALIFMSFTIGRDLGFVLAKGVLFSLISIFFVLPALILMFDKLIAKTKKKSPHFKMDFLGILSYKIRYVAIVLFIGAFGISYFWKGNLGISYTQTGADEVAKVFNTTNQIALVYKSEDEKEVSKYLKEIESQENVDEVLGYGNTINEKLTYDKLNQKFEDLEADTQVENYLLKIVYYNYYNKDEDNTMSFNEFVNFVKKDVYKNKEVADKIDKETKNNIERLSNFTNKTSINKKRTISEISNILDISKEDVKDILIYYNSKNNSTKISLSDFIKFMNKDVVTNKKYSSKINKNAKASLNTLSKFTNTNTIKKEMTSKEMAQLLGMPENVVNGIYTYYIVINQINTDIKLNPQKFVDFMLEHRRNPILESNLDKNTVNELELLKTVMSSTIKNKKYSSTEMAKLLGMNTNDVKLLYGLYNSTYINTNQKISLNKLVEFILNDVMNNSEYSSKFDKEAKLELKTINNIMNASLKNTKYTKNEIFIILSKLADNVDKDQVDLLYMYYGSANEYNKKWQLTVEEFVNYLNNDILQDKRFDNFIENDMRKDITDAKDKIDDSKELLIGDNYSRVVINTKLKEESDETFRFIQKIKDELGNNLEEFYIIGDSPMAYEMSQTFEDELNLITIITMVSIFIVVAVTFKSICIPLILVLTIQCAVYMTMGILSFTGENVYFIALLIVQSILMGATIDYAIVYTTYYIEHRKTMKVKDAIINSYNKSVHTILTSASILIIVTLIIGKFANAIAAMICKTISQGTLCSAILILMLLPAILAGCDKIIIRKKAKYKGEM